MPKCPDCGDIDEVKKAIARIRISPKEIKEEERDVCPKCNQAL